VSSPISEDLRSATNPLFNQNKLKIGVFAFNGTAGCLMTKVPELYQATWSNSLDVAMQADAAGFDVIVPYARWKPFGDAHHPSAHVFENFTWASAIAARTQYSGIMSTCHVPLMHPILVAKAAATIDHVSGGRFGINIVCGWYRPEFEMFGASLLGHDERYDYAEEWITIIKKLWTEDDEFDFDGRYFRILRGMSQPKPIQKPLPALMNAGASDRGRRFVAKHSDLAFVFLQSHEDEYVRKHVDAYRKLAYEVSGRPIQIWCICYVVQRDSYEDAVKYVDYYAVEHGDESYADIWIDENLARSKGLPPDVQASLRRAIKAGYGGVPLLGTPENITDRLERLSKSGVDGVLLIWVDFQNGIRQFNRHVLPLLEQSGLRGAVRTGDTAKQAATPGTPTVRPDYGPDSNGQTD
jgi:FMNH2-dependent dimethyl sulfone monooxygenase